MSTGSESGIQPRLLTRPVDKTGPRDPSLVIWIRPADPGPAPRAQRSDSASARLGGAKLAFCTCAEIPLQCKPSLRDKVGLRVHRREPYQPPRLRNPRAIAERVRADATCSVVQILQLRQVCCHALTLMASPPPFSSMMERSHDIRQHRPQLAQLKSAAPPTAAGVGIRGGSNILHSFWFWVYPYLTCAYHLK